MSEPVRVSPRDQELNQARKDLAGFLCGLVDKYEMTDVEELALLSEEASRLAQRVRRRLSRRRVRP